MKYTVYIQPKTWNIAVTFSLIFVLINCTIAQNVDSKNSTTVAHKDILTNNSTLKGNKGIDRTDSYTDSGIHYEAKEERDRINTSTSSVDVSNPKELNNPDNIVVTFISEVEDKTTSVPETNGDEGSPTKFNFAIIAALGVLILVIALCLKCCSWFRAYTRAGDKEDSTNQYAAILHTGDEEYGHVDIQSDTASTVYFDTISSYHSFLARNGNGSSIKSSKSPQRAPFSRQSSGSPRHLNGTPVLKDLDVKYMEMKQIRTRAETPDTASPRSESAMSDNVRTFSVSSEDTEPSTATLSTSINDDLNNSKKAQKFKVSFTTDMSVGPNKLERQRSYNRSSLKRIPAERHNRSMSCRSTSSRLSDINDGVFRLKPINKRVQLATGVGNGVDVATQTNKSFTYSRWKSRKRYYSDSGVDEIFGPPTINELSSVGTYTDNCGHACVSPSKLTKLKTHTEQCEIPNVLNEQINAKPVTSCETPISETESSDDVFATDGSVTAGHEFTGNPCDNNNSCKCVVNNNGRVKHDCSLVYSDKSPSSTSSSSNNPDSTQESVNIDNTGDIYITPRNRNSDRNMDLHIDQCKDCLQRRNLITDLKPRCKCKSGPLCDLFLVDETDINSNSDNCDAYVKGGDSVIQCSTLSRNTVAVDVFRVKDGIARLKNAVNEGHTLIIEQDMTSSMTSLESSGYAEISSDASTS